MNDFAAAFSASTYADRAQEWLRAQAGLDWRAAGLRDFDDWDQAITTVARLIASSSAPMALMLGPRGVLLANEVATGMVVETTGLMNGRSVLDVLPQSASFFTAVLAQVLSGQSLSFRELPTRLMVDGAPRTHWLNLDFMPVSGDDGAIQAVLGAASDLPPLSSASAACPIPSNVCAWRRRIRHGRHLDLGCRQPHQHRRR